MTNREAIEVIKLAQAQVEWEYPMDYAAAFDIAISALQAQEAKHSTESSSTHRALDTISRQAVYDALLAEPLKWDDSSVWESARCYQWMMDMDAIKALPSAQSEPP